MAEWPDGEDLREQVADEIGMEAMVLMERRERLLARLNYAERFRASDTAGIRRMADELEELDDEIEALEYEEGFHG